MIGRFDISFFSPLLCTHVKLLTVISYSKVVLIDTQPIKEDLLSTYYVVNSALDPGERREGYIKYVKVHNMSPRSQRFII